MHVSTGLDAPAVAIAALLRTSTSASGRHLRLCDARVGTLDRSFAFRDARFELERDEEIEPDPEPSPLAPRVINALESVTVDHDRLGVAAALLDAVAAEVMSNKWRSSDALVAQLVVALAHTNEAAGQGAAADVIAGYDRTYRRFAAFRKELLQAAKHLALIEAVSMDLGPAYLKSVQADGHAPQALVCADVFHLVKLVGDALDEVRRDLWQQLRKLPDDRYAKAFKGSRWALLKNPGDLTATQTVQLAKIRRTRGGIWRAYEMKEQFRAIFTGGLEPADAIVLLDRWCTRALRSRLTPFVKAARTMRDRRGIIVNAINEGISNGRVEGLIIWSG